MTDRAGGAELHGNLRCDVPGCPRLEGFATAQGLGAHKKHVHGLDGDGPNASRDAGRAVASRATAARRAERGTPAPEDCRVPCPFCTDTFGSRAGQASHVRFKHPNESEEIDVASAQDVPDEEVEVDEPVEEVGEDCVQWSPDLILTRAESDTIDALAFLNGIDPAEYVASIVRDAVSVWASDPDLQRLIAIRAQRRSHG